MSEDQAFRFAGWWCGQNGRPADRRQLACLIDKVALLSAGEDKGLRALFTQAEKIVIRLHAAAHRPGRAQIELA